MPIVIAFCLSLLLCVVPNAYSAPGEITNKLMDDYVTVLDFGVFRLNQDVNDRIDVINSDYLKPSAQVNYDFERDQFLISINLWPKNLIGQNLKLVRVNYSEDAIKREIQMIHFEIEQYLSEGNVADVFAHSGFKVKQYQMSDKDISQLLSKIVIAYAFTAFNEIVPISRMEDGQYKEYKMDLEAFYVKAEAIANKVNK